MDKSKLTNLTGEIIAHSERLMKVSDIADALKAAYDIDNHKVRETTVKALLEQLDRFSSSASSIWWRALEINKELAGEPNPTPADISNQTPEQELAELEDTAVDDLPFC